MESTSYTSPCILVGSVLVVVVLVVVRTTLVADLVLGACSVFGCADEHVNVAALARLVQMLPDGEHCSSSFAPTFHPERGQHPIDHLDIALQLHCYQILDADGSKGSTAYPREREAQTSAKNQVTYVLTTVAQHTPALVLDVNNRLLNRVKTSVDYDKHNLARMN